MTTDYDTRRPDSGEEVVEALEELQEVAAKPKQPEVEQDEAEVADSFELPGADLSHESLDVWVEPQHADEFTCSRCFLVHHHSQLADPRATVCRDCA